MSATSAQRRLAENIAEGTTSIARQYLGGTIQWFTKLIQAAQSKDLTDAEFVALLQAKAANVADELLPLLDAASLAAAMEANMGAAIVNGAVGGWLARQKKKGGSQLSPSRSIPRASSRG
ncbi:MAG TPA: hypothetical protein VMB21_19120 [Candidatus Limnocylindria bacterium]|nr:hypothetical protein [Candidatus Limnocylindria bacterium]